MAHFDVYANPAASERKHTPYLLDLQNDFIDGLATRVVAPLHRPASFGPRARTLHPLLTVNEQELVLDTSALGALPLALLRRPVGNLRDARAPVQEALDALFGNF